MSSIKVVCLDGLIGAGKSTIMEKLMEQGQSFNHPLLGEYDLYNNIVAVKENIKLYNSHNCLKKYNADPSLSCYFSLKVKMDQTVILHTALQVAAKHGASVLLLERHMMVSRLTFSKLAFEFDAAATPFEDAMLDVAYLKLKVDFGHQLEDGKVLHGIIYMKTTLQQALENIKHRGRPEDKCLIEEDNGRLSQCKANNLLEPLLEPAFKEAGVPVLTLEPAYNSKDDEKLIKHIFEFCQI